MCPSCFRNRHGRCKQSHCKRARPFVHTINRTLLDIGQNEGSGPRVDISGQQMVLQHSQEQRQPLPSTFEASVTFVPMFNRVCDESTSMIDGLLDTSEVVSTIMAGAVCLSGWWNTLCAGQSYVASQERQQTAFESCLFQTWSQNTAHRSSSRNIAVHTRPCLHRGSV